MELSQSENKFVKGIMEPMISTMQTVINENTSAIKSWTTAVEGLQEYRKMDHLRFYATQLHHEALLSKAGIFDDKDENIVIARELPIPNFNANMEWYKLAKNEMKKRAPKTKISASKMFNFEK